MKTNELMLQVIIALIPSYIVLTYYFGISFLISSIFTCLLCLLFEIFCVYARGRNFKKIIFDNSAIVTALLISVCLPPNTSPIVYITSSFFAIVIAKQIYGGLGQNIFNPAMTGFVAVLIGFPQFMIYPDLNASYLDILNNADSVVQATTLDILKQKDNLEIHEILDKANYYYPILNLSFLLGGSYLIYKKVISYTIPLTIIISALALALIMNIYDSSRFLSPLRHLFIGSFMCGAFFILTDPVSCPSSFKGRIIFAILSGILIILIRSFSNYPDSIAFTTLIVNAISPLIDNFIKEKVYGS